MNRVACMPVAERRLLFSEAAERLQIQPVIVEKDFWVCWVLGLLFGRPEWSEALVFKGGTALSKVFGIIRRFSEDIDLSVSPKTLGISETDVEQAGSRRQRDQWMEELETACGQWVTGRLQPEFEPAISFVLGNNPSGPGWLEFQTDAATHSPLLLFQCPAIFAKARLIKDHGNLAVRSHKPIRQLDAIANSAISPSGWPAPMRAARGPLTTWLSIPACSPRPMSPAKPNSNSSSLKPVSTSTMRSWRPSWRIKPASVKVRRRRFHIFCPMRLSEQHCSAA